MREPQKKMCMYHHKLEPINYFQKNSYKKDGLQDCCRVGQNAMMNIYNEEHREPVNQKSLVYADHRKGKIDEEKKVTLIRSINKQYGIKSRV